MRARDAIYQEDERLRQHLAWVLAPRQPAPAPVVPAWQPTAPTYQVQAQGLPPTPAAQPNDPVSLALLSSDAARCSSRGRLAGHCGSGDRPGSGLTTPLVRPVEKWFLAPSARQPHRLPPRADRARLDLPTLAREAETAATGELAVGYDFCLAASTVMRTAIPNDSAAEPQRRPSQIADLPVNTDGSYAQCQTRMDNSIAETEPIPKTGCWNRQKTVVEPLYTRFPGEIEMALPLIFGLVTVGVGIKKCIDANNMQASAQVVMALARQTHADAQQRRDDERLQTNAKLERIALRKLDVAKRHLGRFVQLIAPIHHVKLTGVATDHRISPLKRDELTRFGDVAFQAGQLLSSGTMALGTGALTGIAVYGLTTTLAAASTGTAIATLSGAAATNATFAALGGGALAAGGLGIVGGYAALSLLVAGPAMIIGGALAEAKGRENLARASVCLAEARLAAADLDRGTSAIVGVGEVADQFDTYLQALEQRAETVLNRLERMIRHAGTDYRDYSQAQCQQLWAAVAFSRGVKQVLDLSLIGEANDSGSVASFAIAEARRLLRLGA